MIPVSTPNEKTKFPVVNGYIKTLIVHKNGYLIFFRCKIAFYFSEWTQKAEFLRETNPRVKIPLLVFMSEIKFDTTLKKKKKKKKFFYFCVFIYNNYAFT